MSKFETDVVVVASVNCFDMQYCERGMRSQAGPAYYFAGEDMRSSR